MRRYHHIGIPTTEAKPGETHLKHLKLYVVSHEKSEFGVEWMRFEADAADVYKRQVSGHDFTACGKTHQL